MADEPGLMVPVELVKKEADRCRRFTPDDSLLTPEARAAAVAMAVSEAVILDSLIASAVPCGEEGLREAGYRVVAAWATEGNHGLQDAMNKLASLVLPTRTAQQHTTGGE